MRYFAFFACLYLLSACTQTVLRVHNSGLDSIYFEISSYSDFVLPSKNTVANRVVLRMGESNEMKFDHDRTSKMVISTADHSMELYVQPDETYDVFLSNDGITIESGDKINETIATLNTYMGIFYKQIFKLETEQPADIKEQVLALLSDLMGFQNNHIGTEYQNQLIKYKLATCQSVAFDVLKDRQAIDSLENTFLVNQKVDVQNPEYIKFLFDYYLLRYRYDVFRRQNYSDDESGLEILKSEVKYIANDTVRQLALFHVAKESYNYSWFGDNSEVIEIFDSLAQYGLLSEVRHSAEALSHRLKSLKKGAQLPDFDFTDLTGQTIHLSDFRGKYLLLDFWYIGCIPCHRDIPYLRQLHSDFNLNLEIVSINNRDDQDKIADYIKQNGLEWSFLRTTKDSDVMTGLQINQYPTYFLLDPERKILLQPIDFTEEEDLYNLVAAHLKTSLVPSKFQSPVSKNNE